MEYNYCETRIIFGSIHSPLLRNFDLSLSLSLDLANSSLRIASYAIRLEPFLRLSIFRREYRCIGVAYGFAIFEFEDKRYRG